MIRLLAIMLCFCVPCQAGIQKLPKTHRTGPIVIKNSPTMRIPDLAPLPEGFWVRLHNVEVIDRTDSWVTVKHPGALDTIKVYSEQHAAIGDHVLLSGQLTDDGSSITTYCDDAQHKLQGYITILRPYQHQAGTINYAMEQPDRTNVSFTAVDLDRIKNLADGAQLLTCSTNDSLPILVLLPTKVPTLKDRLTLDVEGTLVRLPNKDTVVVNPKVTGYQNEENTELIAIPPLPDGIEGQSYNKLIVCSPAVDFTAPTTFDPEVKIAWITPVSYSSIAMLLAAKPTTGTYVKLHMLRVSSLGSKPGKYMVLKDQPTVSGGKSILLYTAKSLSSSSIVESVIAKVYTVSTTTVLLADDSDPRFDPQTDIGSVNVIN